MDKELVVKMVILSDDTIARSEAICWVTETEAKVG